MGKTVRETYAWQTIFSNMKASQADSDIRKIEFMGLSDVPLLVYGTTFAHFLCSPFSELF